MDIKKELEIKQKELRVLVDAYNQEQQKIQNIANQILKLNGIIEFLKGQENKEKK